MGGGSLSGKVAIVTGGGRGIGRSIVHALADEGADVAIVARQLEPIEEAAREVEERGGRGKAYSADLRSVAEIRGGVRGVHRCASLAQELGGCRTGDVTPADLLTHLQQQAGERTHARPADPDQVDSPRLCQRQLRHAACLVVSCAQAPAESARDGSARPSQCVSGR